MPHLSPLPWVFLMLLFWLFLMSYMVILWFTPSLNLSSLPSFAINTSVAPMWIWS